MRPGKKWATWHKDGTPNGRWEFHCEPYPPGWDQMKDSKPDTVLAKWLHYGVALVILFTLLALAAVVSCVANDWELRRQR